MFNSKYAQYASGIAIRRWWHHAVTHDVVQTRRVLRYYVTCNVTYNAYKQHDTHLPDAV